MAKNFLSVSIRSLLIVCAFSLFCEARAEQEKIKRIEWLQDNAQKYMSTKIYELRHVRASDITPFVEGAIKRYRTDSRIQRLNYADGKKEYLVVSTGTEMLPYVDGIIQALDRPSKKVDAMGSNIEGTGIGNFVYYTKYRTSEDMKDIINRNILDDNGRAYADIACAMIYWKSSLSKGRQIQKWLNALDRPVPQVALTLKVYEVRESVLRDLGIDYVAWKNGPGLDLFGAGADLFNSWGMEKLVEVLGTKGFEYLSGAQFGFGGLFFAPQFDASFIKVLEQEGLATVATSASVTLINGSDATITFAPDFQNIVKSDNDKTTVQEGGATTYTLNVGNSIINFKGEKYTKEQSKDGYLYYEEVPSTVSGTIMFGYDFQVSSPVESNNFGTQLVNTTGMASSLCFDVGKEQLLGTWEQSYDVKQNIGIPFLSDIPILKYLFGTEKISKSTAKVFVTLQAEWVTPDTTLANWAGKLLAEDELIRTAVKPSPVAEEKAADDAAEAKELEGNAETANKK